MLYFLYYGYCKSQSLARACHGLSYNILSIKSRRYGLFLYLSRFRYIHFLYSTKNAIINSLHFTKFHQMSPSNCYRGYYLYSLQTYLHFSFVLNGTEFRWHDKDVNVFDHTAFFFFPPSFFSRLPSRRNIVKSDVYMTVTTMTTKTMLVYI